MKRNISIKRFDNQHYTTFFDKGNGLLIRKEDEGFDEPFWCHSSPELLDISITNWCNKYCDICYRNSNENGKHMNIDDYEKIIKQASSIGVFQVALGGGNPNQHPNFSEILELTNNKYGIVPSFTTNGRGLTDNVLLSSQKYCGAVAISYYEPESEFIKSLELLKNNKIRTNIHFVLSSESINLAIKWLVSPPEFLNGVNAIIFLNYKAVGAKSENSLLLNNNKNYIKFFEQLNITKYPFKIGFDSCTITGIVNYMKIDKSYLEPCESGRFSAFISENLMMYPCSFMINSCTGISLEKFTIQKIWQKSEPFLNIRSKLLSRDYVCSNCDLFDCCLGGCPFFNNINLCETK